MYTSDMPSIYELGSGAGSSLPTPVLVLAGVSSLIAVLVSAMSVYLQLKNYRKPSLQRMVIRIMIMVPIYAISSLISLFSLEAAFVIDAIRDIYEAFVIYCFFVLLLSYLGGERSLLILLHGRPPKAQVFPASLFKREIDVSDPYTFLFLKRGILQYVQVKPVLAIATLILKACGKFNEGDLKAGSGYLYVSIIYNISICLSLYCLAIFWMCVNQDLKPFRPVPKFLCVKGILFFSFWQALGVSILVAAGVITKLGPYTSEEKISLGLTDLLICIEMPFFAIAHMFAFSYTDFIDPSLSYVARMPMYYAFRDAFGLLDVVEDSKATLRGEGMDYREFEPSEGLMHQGAGRDRRIRAGLRYSKGGRGKYWLPKPSQGTQPPGRVERGVNHIIKSVAGRDQGEEIHAPLLGVIDEDIVHLAPDLIEEEEDTIWGEPHTEDGYELPFGEIDEGDEELFDHSRKYLFGDYNYPCIDVSSEAARTTMWDEEERILRDEQGAWFAPIRGSKGQLILEHNKRPWEGYGAVGTTETRERKTTAKGKERHRGFPGNDTVIDYEQDQTPAEEPTDVQLRWARIQGRPSPSPSTSRPQSPHLRNRPNLQYTEGTYSGPSSIESSSSPARRGIASRNNSRQHQNTKPESPLPPDAVDLIVEDNRTAQEEQTRVRRKGEPAVRGSALKKVYKRGFIADDAQGPRQEEEGPDEEEHQRTGGAGKRIDFGEESLNTIGDEDEEAERAEDPRGSDTEAEGIIARLNTPPLHARVFIDDVPGSGADNPWA